MNPITQIFFNDFTAPGTGLSRVLGIDCNQLSTSIFGFVRKKTEELCPCRIIDTLIQNSETIFNHFFGLKFFNINITKLVNYLPAEFMLKVFTLVADFFMQAGKFLFQSLASLFGILTLCFFEFGFRLFQIFRIIDHLAIGHSGKRLDSHIDSDFFCGGRKNILRNSITRKRSIESAILPFNCNCFDNTLNIPVEIDSDVADILDIKFSAFKFNPIAIDRESDRIEIIQPLKSGKARLVARLNSSEEGLKGFVKLSKNILRTAIIKLSETFIKATNFFKRISLIVIINRFAPLLPANNTLFKGTIIEKTGRTKKLTKLYVLGFVCKQPVFEGLSHFLFSRYSSIALRMSSATFSPVSFAKAFSPVICCSVMYVSILFIRIIYTFNYQMSRKRRMRIPLSTKACNPLHV